MRTLLLISCLLLSTATAFGTSIFRTQHIEEGGVRLLWELPEDERGIVTKFVVEHSVNGFTYSNILQVGVADTLPNGNYIFYDKNFTIGRNYYRLRFVSEEDGVYRDEYSSTSVLGPENQIIIFPNPTADWVRITANDTYEEFVEIMITDMNGNIIFHHKDVPFEDNWTYDFNFSTLPTGKYYLLFKSDLYKEYEVFPLLVKRR